MAATVDQEIVALEHQTWDALKKSGRELITFLATDCRMIFPGGTIFSQDSDPTLLEVLSREGTNVSDFHASDCAYRKKIALTNLQISNLGSTTPCRTSRY